MRDYVAGLLFSRSCTEVLLIKKRRPDWQAGLWNGLGGHVTSGEKWAEAMHRKAVQEANVDVEWQKIAAVVWEGTCVHFYAAASNAALRQFQQRTDEEPRIHSVGHMADVPVVNVLRFMIPMAAHHLLHEKIFSGTILQFDGSGGVPDSAEKSVIRRIFSF